MTTLTVIRHGSFWAGAEDPGDVDIMVVTDETISQAEAVERVRPYLPDPWPGTLPLDLHIASSAEVRQNIYRRALIQQGTIVEGPPVADVEPVAPAEWVATMRLFASPWFGFTAGTIALNLLRAWWAEDGRLVLPKSAVPAAAVRTPYETLAARAWAARKDPTVTADALLTAVGVCGPAR